MEQYLEKAKEVLKILINNGSEAYIIGECVCKIIMEKPFDNIEITTNATPDMVKGIFSELGRARDYKDGMVHLQYLGYDFIISTFRSGEKPKDRRIPEKSHYSKNFKDELAVRDFTITALALSSGNKYIDIYNGYNDIKKKRIRTIGQPNIRFSEEPIRMLIALRLVSELGFRLDRKTFKAMKRKAKLLRNVPLEDIAEELALIFEGKYLKRSLSYLIEAKVHKHIKELKKAFQNLAYNYKRISIDTFIASSYVINKQYTSTWDRIIEDPQRTKQVVELALANPRSKFDPLTLFNYGLEVCLDSNYVNYMLKKSRLHTKKIRKLYSRLPIKNESEINFEINDIFKIANRMGDFGERIYEDIIKKIVMGELANNYDDIRTYVINALKFENVNIYEERELPKKPPTYNEYHDSVHQAYQSPARKIDSEIDKVQDYQTIQSNQKEYNMQPKEEQRIDSLDKRFDEYERSLREKDLRIRELERQALEYKLESDINMIVGQNLEILRDLNYLEKGAEKIMISRELKEVYKDLIKNVDPKYNVLIDKKEGSNTNNEKEN